MKIQFKDENDQTNKEFLNAKPKASFVKSKNNTEQKINEKIRINIREEEKNTFQKTHGRMQRMEKRSRNIIFLAVAVVAVYFIVILIPTGLDYNNTNASFAWWNTMFMRHVRDLAAFLSGDQAEFMNMVTARYIMAALAGAVLAISGTVFQGALRNSLASPTTLGVQSGGVMGGTIYVMFFMPLTDAVIHGSDAAEAFRNLTVFERYEESIFILAGSLIAVLFVTGVSKIAGKGKISTITLVLTGMIFGAAASGITGLVRYWMLLYDTFGDRTYELRFMMMGTFSRVLNYEQVLYFGIPAAVGIFVVMMLRNRLNMIVFGEDEARTMGVRVDLTRNILIVVVTIMVAFVISLCGMIGFIGFIVPHIVRRITGPDYRWLLPGSALFGAIILMVIYCIGSVFNYADNVNVLTSFIGGIIFLIMLIVYRRRSDSDWA